MVGPDNPEHKLVFAVPLFLALGLFAGSNGQEFAKDLFRPFPVMTKSRRGASGPCPRSYREKGELKSVEAPLAAHAKQF
jgi:hypothetical protein